MDSFRKPSPPRAKADRERWKRGLRGYGLDPDALDDGIAAAEGERMVDAWWDWGTLQANPPLPKLTFEAAKAWARGAWYLHRAAVRPFAGGERLIFLENHFQARYQEAQRHGELVTRAREPVPAVTAPGDTEEDTTAPEGAIVVDSIYLPDAVKDVLDRLPAADCDTILHYIEGLEVRQAEMLMHGLASYTHGIEDARALVHTSRGPRPDTSLERALHLGTMVKYLVGRGLRRGRNPATHRHESATDAVAYGAGMSFSAVRDAWESFMFVAKMTDGREDRKWAEVLQEWQKWNHDRRGGDKKKRIP